MTSEQTYYTAYKKACAAYTMFSGEKPTPIQEAKAEYTARYAAYKACEEGTEEQDAAHIAWLKSGIILHEYRIESDKKIIEYIETNMNDTGVNEFFDTVSKEIK